MMYLIRHIRQESNPHLAYRILITSKKIISSRLETIFDEALIPDSIPKGKEEMTGLHHREMVDIIEAVPQPTTSKHR